MVATMPAGRLTVVAPRALHETDDGRDGRAERPPQTFEELVQPLLGSLYHTALSFVRNPADAEDAVQETLLRAYRAFERFEHGTNFKAWLFRILTNYCINRHRRGERAPDSVAYHDIEREAEAAGARQQEWVGEPVAAVFDELLDEQIERAIDTLPMEFRAVLVLADLQDQSYKEIADQLSIPIGTVRSRLFRARRLMRDQLTDYALERGYIRERDRESAA